MFFARGKMLRNRDYLFLPCPLYYLSKLTAFVKQFSLTKIAGMLGLKRQLGAEESYSCSANGSAVDSNHFM